MGESCASECSSSHGSPRTEAAVSRSRQRALPNERRQILGKNEKRNSESSFQLEAHVGRRIGAITSARAMVRLQLRPPFEGELRSAPFSRRSAASFISRESFST